MSDAAISAAPAGAEPFKGTPVRDLMAGGVAFGVVVVGAHLLSNTLKGMMDDSVRSGAVGVLFASVPAVYGLMRKAIGQVGPRRAAPAPELGSWFITGLFAGISLFAWTRFISVLVGMGMGAVQSVTGGFAPSEQAALFQALGVLVTFLMVPTLLVWSVVAGRYLYKSTRSFTWLAAILAVVTLLGMDAFLSFVLFREQNMAFLNATTPGTSPLLIYLKGLVILAVPTAIGILIGVAASALRRERQPARIASLARRLDREERAEMVEAMRERIAAKV